MCACKSGNALHFLTSLRAEVAQRIIRHSLNLSDWPHDRWKQSIPTKWCMITITGHNPGQHPAHLWQARDVQLWQSHLAGIACSSQSAPENLWYCRKKKSPCKKNGEREIQTWDTGSEAEVYMYWRFPFINWSSARLLLATRSQILTAAAYPRLFSLNANWCSRLESMFWSDALNGRTDSFVRAMQNNSLLRNIFVLWFDNTMT